MGDADFLRAICAAPADAAPRLAYADWLDERAGPGDVARAEAIRQLEEPYTFPPGQEPYLTFRGECDLVFDVPAVGPELAWTVRRGFPCGLHAPHDAVLHLAEHDRLFATCPIEFVGLTDRAPYRHSVDHHLWLRAGSPDADEWAERHGLDPRVFAGLAGHPAAGPRDEQAGFASFPTPEAAVAAASWAMVNVGRELAGLPPLAPVWPVE